jgi:segregation and condensation protein A
MKSKPELKIVVSNSPEAPAVEPPPEQVEMPFAIVNGEPVTQMPRDLYIPPQAMEVFLEAFEGPLDLLLYLIRRQNLNILDIPLAEITRQYMKYIEVMTELQLELAGEYMVMAATLAEIKSRMLLPRPKVDPDGSEEDPRAELVRRLQEYERFKRAAEGIDGLPRLERDVWTTSAELKDRKVVRVLPHVTLQEMLLAFKDVVVRSEMFAHHHIQRERLSVRARMGDILSALEHSSFIEFVRLFRPEEGRMGITVTFVAILELVREGLIDIVQAEPFAPLHVRAAGANRRLHVVGRNDAIDGDVDGGARDGEKVFTGPVIGDELADVDDDVAGESTVSTAVVLADHVEAIGDALDDNSEFDDDDDLEDLPLEGVDDVLPTVKLSESTHSRDEQSAMQQRVVAAVDPSPLLNPPGADDIEVTSEPPSEPPSDDTARTSATAVEPSAVAGFPVEEKSPAEDPLPEEPAQFDVEYPSPAEEIASGGRAPASESDGEVSLIGDTSIAGEASVVGEESVSGGPAIEVDEFAFDGLPITDKVGEVGRQPAADGQTVESERAGTDDPPSPGEESDE